MTEPQPQPNNKQAGPPLEDRVAILTATLDQLQAEHDRDSLAIVFLLGAVLGVILIGALEYRKVLQLIEEIAPS